MISIVIPVYKNKSEFLKNLKHNMQFLNGCEVIVVNDDPTESIKKEISDISGVVLFENTTNMGFGITVNEGVKYAKGEYVLLLNSDVLLTDSTFAKTIELFQKNSSLFGVSFAQKERDGAIVGKNSIYWANGFFNHKKADDLAYGKNGWAEGGTCLIDKAKFLQLGGFDSLYSPFYWEDVDLSYRAWKMGYEILFDPSVQMIHHHESTIGKYFSKNRVHTIAVRNQLIFIWKNITDNTMLTEHLKALIKLKINALLHGEFWKLNAIFQASTKLPAILKRRQQQEKGFTRKDTEILTYFQK